MRRRTFVKKAALGVPLLASGVKSLAGIEKNPKKTKEKLLPEFKFDEWTISKFQREMKSGRLTCQSIVRAYLVRIREIDKNGPAINSVLELNPDALVIAKKMDRARKKGGSLGPLFGIPVLIKANIDTADRMTTTAGSLALAGSIPPQDAFIVKQLRKAGAIILGKTNLSEWANFRSERSSSGWSSQGGQTKNPYALDRNPCGSSSGSGAAVSANLCVVSIGTETNGSIVCPANANGIVGIKPTVGLLSRSGIIPISITQDTAGPMARTVTDAVTLLGVLTGVDNRDPATQKAKGRFYKDYTPFLQKDGLKGARIGLARNYCGFHEKVDEMIENSIKVMKDMGATIIDPANIETRKKYGKASYNVLLYEFKDGLNRYLASLGKKAPVKSLKELIAFNQLHREKVMPYFQQEIFLKAEKKGPLTSTEYLQALQKCRRLSRTEGIDATIKKHKLDCIIAPTGSPAWKTDLIIGDNFLGSSSSPAARSGYPNITVPTGFVFGLPVGLSFFGLAYSEPTLICLAYAFEQATKVRKKPTFPNTVL